MASLSDHEWNIESTIAIGAGLSIAFSLWWMYFDNVEGSPIRAFREKGRVRIYTTWIYLHFPLVVGLVSSATGIRYIVSAAQDVALSYTGEWLICGSVSLCLFSIGSIQFTIASTSDHDGDGSNNSRRKNLRFKDQFIGYSWICHCSYSCDGNCDLTTIINLNYNCNLYNADHIGIILIIEFFETPFMWTRH